LRLAGISPYRDLDLGISESRIDGKHCSYQGWPEISDWAISTFLFHGQLTIHEVTRSIAKQFGFRAVLTEGQSHILTTGGKAILSMPHDFSGKAVWISG
jgi:hypothetical protein